MRRRLANLFVGLIFIAIGGCYALNTIFDWNFSIFFDGWWAFFIIVPSVYDMISTKIRARNVVIFLFGVWIFLACQDKWDWNLWKLTVPVLFVLIGLAIIFKGHEAKVYNYDKVNVKAGKVPYISAILCGTSPSFVDKEFEGANITAILGGAEINLRNSIIKNDCIIEITAILGGVDILLPSGVKVIFNSNPILGGCDNKYISSTDVNAPVVTINASCICGGVDIM